MKTGSTSLAGFCLSAVASRKDITLISVVMAAETSKGRNKDAASMLNYGFSRCSLYRDTSPGELPELPVAKGVQDQVSLCYEKEFRYLSTDGTVLTDVEKVRNLPEKAEAPVEKGQQAGTLVYYSGGKKLGSVPILYGETIKRAGYGNCLRKAGREFLL